MPWFFLYPLKTSENLWFSDIFRGYRKRPLAWNLVVRDLATRLEQAQSWFNAHNEHIVKGRSVKTTWLKKINNCDIRTTSIWLAWFKMIWKGRPKSKNLKICYASHFFLILDLILTTLHLWHKISKQTKVDFLYARVLSLFDLISR